MGPLWGATDVSLQCLIQGFACSFRGLMYSAVFGGGPPFSLGPRAFAWFVCYVALTFVAPK